MKKITALLLLGFFATLFVVTYYFSSTKNNLTPPANTPKVTIPSSKKEMPRYTRSIDNGHTIETSLYKIGSAPTPEQKIAADQLRKDSWETILKNGWLSKDKAYQDGYSLLRGDALHSINREFIYDNEVLNPEKPEIVMYYDTPKGKRLAGVMYLINNLGDHGPQPGGPLTVWHYHKTEQSDDCVETERQLIIADCTGKPDDIRPTTTFGPEMLHVWFIEHPEGPFASSMEIWGDPLKQLLDEKFNY